MANLVTSLCCVVLAAVVVAYAQRRIQLVARNQYERMGSDVTMQCGSLESGTSVSWKVNGTDVQAKHQLEGPVLILNQVDLSHNGLYSCFQNPHGERRDTIYLHVGVPPREPLITCRSNTYPKGFYCNWHLQMRWCGKDAVHKNRCHVRFPEVFSSYPYVVNVTVINALGKAFNTYVFEESNIVKPDPPERVTATPIRFNPRRLEVSWQSPATWPEIDSFPLKYFLRYRPLIREQWQHVSTTFKSICVQYRIPWMEASRVLFQELGLQSLK
uniref:Ciliary neurotrophic factor receptor n=1 Tax=Nothobranchius furzeri TaxID=105023 RepID=A0A8C6PBQ5_NOTFU